MGHAPSTPAGNNSPAENNSTPETTSSEVFNPAQSEQPSTSIRDGIINSLRNFWDRKEMTDLVVVIGNNEIKCHSFILCACSSYFADQLLTRRVTSNETRLYFTSFSKETFVTILDMLYTGTDLLTSNNIIDVWWASHELGISFLLTECEDRVLKHLSFENFAELHKYATLLGSDRVSEAAFEFMLTNFEVLKERPAFLDLSFEHFLQIIDNQYLLVSSEDVVIDAILKWVKHVSENNSLVSGNQDTQTGDAENSEPLVDWTNYLDRLLSASRLCLVSPDCLAMLVTCRIVQDHVATKTAVDRAMRHQLRVAARHIHSWPVSAVHRNSSDLQNVVFAGRADGSISVLSLLYHNIYYNVKPSTAFTGCCISMTVFDDTVYALACQTVGDIFSTLYMLDKLEWQKVAHIPGAEHVLVPHGKSIYFIQPVTKTVIKLDHPFSGKTIQPIVAVPSTGRVVSCLPLGGTILAFCSKSESPEEKTTVHCLDTVTGTWRRLSNLEGPAKLVSFRDDKDTYILQTSGAVSRIVETHGGRVDFKLVARFWSDLNPVTEHYVAGCVRLGKSLFICRSLPDFPAASNASGQNKMKFHELKHTLSMAGVIDTKYLDYKADFFLPIILEKKVFHSIKNRIHQENLIYDII